MSTEPLEPRESRGLGRAVPSGAEVTDARSSDAEMPFEDHSHVAEVSPAGRPSATTLDQANDHLGALIDAVVAGFAEAAAAQARAAERVEELRRWSLVTADIAARHQGKERPTVWTVRSLSGR